MESNMTPPNSQAEQHHHQLQPQQQQHQQSQVDSSAVMPGSGGGGGGIPAHLMGSGGPGSRLEYHQIPSQHLDLQQQQQHFQQQQQQQQQLQNHPPLMQRQNQGMINTPGIGGGGMPPNSAGMPPSSSSSGPNGGGVVGGGGVVPHPSPPPSQTIADPASLPWTVGSTDGSFATMMIMQQSQQEQHHQQQQRQHQQQPFQNSDRIPAGSSADGVGPPTSAGGATIGDLGEAKDAATNGNVKSTDRTSNHLAALTAIQAGRSLYHDRLFHQSPSSVESVLTSSCDVMGFDIAEMWLRTGPKTHQLTNSHLRPTSLEDSVRKDLVEVYYGEKSNERTHRLSPALCKRAKDANDVVWVTAHTPHGAEALRMSISNVRTAVAVPVCHEASNTNITIIYFSIRRYVF